MTKSELNLPHFPTAFYQRRGPDKHRAAVWCPIQREWFQDGRELRNIKASKSFVWPKDGRNGTAWGRFKDILQNKGPDVFLTINANKHDYMQNRPSSDRWASIPGLDYTSYPTPLSSTKHASWIQKGGLGGRMPGMQYDFRTRKYGVPNCASWTGAVWQPEPRKNKHNLYPEAYRDVYGDWFQDFHYRPQNRGGPVHNEQGKGAPRCHLRRWLP
jgi:hypothetical protein